MRKYTLLAIMAIMAIMALPISLWGIDALQNTQQYITFGPLRSNDDGYSLVRDFTIGDADEAVLIKPDGTYVDLKTHTCTHIAGGMYRVQVGASDVATLGPGYAIMTADSSGILPDAWPVAVKVAHVYNTDYGSDAYEVEVNTNNDKEGYSISGTKQTLDALNDPTAEQCKADTNGLATLPGQQAIQADLDNPSQYQAETSGLATLAALSAHDGKLDTVDTVVDGIQDDLDNATDGLGALRALIIALNDLSESQINAQALAALDTYRLDELLYATLESQPAPGSLLADLTEDNAGTQRLSAAALAQAPTGSGLSQQDVRDAMKLAPSAGEPASGSIDAEIDSTLGDTDELQQELADGGRLDLIFDATLGDTNELQGNQTSWLTADLTTLNERLTAARAGYLDNLNVTGTLAHSDAADTYKAIGFSTLTAADVWQHTLEDAFSAEQLMRLFAAMLAGAIDVDGTTMYIKSLDGSVNRITFTSGTGGDRNVSARVVTD